MNGNELSKLIHHRWSLLRTLLELSGRQMEAIESGRMSELMRLLSDKQAPLNELAAVAEKIRTAVDDDPNERTWPDETTRVSCRQQQEECEQMHLELLAIEAQCETALQTSRNQLSQKIDRVDAARQAANTYAHSPTGSDLGGQLDLSSD